MALENSPQASQLLVLLWRTWCPKILREDLNFCLFVASFHVERSLLSLAGGFVCCSDRFQRMPVFVFSGAIFGAAEQSAGDQMEPPARAGPHGHQEVPGAPFRSLHQQPQAAARQSYGREGTVGL